MKPSNVSGKKDSWRKLVEELEPQFKEGLSLEFGLWVPAEDCLNAVERIRALRASSRKKVKRG